MIPFFSQFFPWNIQGPSTKDFDMGSWFSRHYHFSGNPRIEKEVVENVASYGKQLGVLSEVVLALAEEEGKEEKVNRLKKMVGEIEEIKKKHTDVLQKDIKFLLDQLKQRDPEIHKQVLDKQRKE